MKKIILGILAVLAMSISLHAGYMEPTQADYDCCFQAIGAQQNAYVDAKNSGDYQAMLDNALFHYVKAWIYFNHAMSIAKGKGAYQNAETLKSTVEFFDKATAELAIPGAVEGDGAKCAKLITRNKDWVEARISKLTSSK